jgi:Flp pilus assembly protein TadD
MQTTSTRIRNSIVAASCLALIWGCAGAGSGRLPFWPGNRSLATAEPPFLDPAQTADMQLALARMAEQQQQWSIALTIYRQLLDADPKQPEATHRLAILYDRQDDFEQSAQWFQKALKLKPGDPEVFCDIGYSLYLQGRYGEAEINLRQAAAISPDDHRTQNHLGLVLAQTGRPEDAFVAFRRANCSPAQAHANLAFVLALSNQLDKARQHLEYAQSVEPHDRQLQNRIAGLEALIADRASNEQAPPTLPDVQLADLPDLHQQFSQPKTERATLMSLESAPAPPRRVELGHTSEPAFIDDSNPEGFWSAPRQVNTGQRR